MGAQVFKINKWHLFARKPVINNISRSAAPQQALVPANRYNCDVSRHMLMSMPSFIRIERGSDGGKCP